MNEKENAVMEVSSLATRDSSTAIYKGLSLIRSIAGKKVGEVEK